MKIKKTSTKLLNILLASFFLIAIFMFSLVSLNSTTHADDLLETAFQESIANENIIMLWNGKDAVGNDVFREGQDIQTNARLKKTCFINNKEFDVETEEQCTTMWWERKRVDLVTRPPLMVRIAKFLLRITVALAITMVLYNSIMYIVESVKGPDKVTKATNNLLYVAWGLILALSSVAIINLISSISISSLRDVSEYTQDNFKDKFNDFCDRAMSNTDTASQLDGRDATKISKFCTNTDQVIVRTNNQRDSFFQRILANPGSRSQTEFAEFMDRIELQYGYVINLK